ncbi:hypothetical protein J421_3714 [Gemmatirosa kalamazoonensis]|uniref:Lipoprotein n=1 Tax=Gemmatirosa kalamazoonensis TaxID=861299 RepID=W0RKH3_9BACT|nr:hypothetical protein [Gemmatirosa kalamazoonensis]AHG91251.1 hypothetical protein J421_3714 [Gemmatirosa kalamazoonensis]
MHPTRPLALGAALLLAACATAPGPRPLTTIESPGEVSLADAAAPVVIHVSSRFAGPLAIYSVSAGVATRLGDVPGGRAEQFRLQATQIPANGLTLLAVPQTGPARASTGVLRVAPGSVVDFTIGASLADARAGVRSP